MGIQAVYIFVKNNEVENLHQLSSEDLLAELERIQKRNESHIDIGKMWKLSSLLFFLVPTLGEVCLYLELQN